MSDAMADESFIQLVASGTRRGQTVPWRKVTIRPVEIRHTRHFQFIYLDERKDVRKNYGYDEAWRETLESVFDAGFAQFHLQSEAGDIHVKISKRGRPLVSRGRPTARVERDRLEHNREKTSLLPTDIAEPYLRAVGIADEMGTVKPTMQAKYRQVNAFLRLLDQKLPDQGGKEMRIVDCGCGSAYLTFAVYAYLVHLKGRRVSITGVDREAERIEKCAMLADQLGWNDVRFVQSTIADYEPETSPDIVLSLHACDTATDEALARGALWDARLLLAAPCCQQELSEQIQADSQRALLKHGILKQRTADLLTDALRAAALEVAGYRTDVVEFTTTEVTSKNLLIRATRTGEGGGPDAVTHYTSLRDFWGVDPCIARLLGTRLAPTSGEENQSVATVPRAEPEGEGGTPSSN
jgi:2-polyprenyl-3-methyl-5-hydroxy-6-metoxy-1,4-benzoquinol methylase